MKTFSLWCEDQESNKTAWKRLYSMLAELSSSDYIEIEALIDPVVEQLHNLGLDEEAALLLTIKMPKSILDYLQKQDDHLSKSDPNPRSQLAASFSFKNNPEIKRQYLDFVKYQGEIIMNILKKVYGKMKDMGFINSEY